MNKHEVLFRSYRKYVVFEYSGVVLVRFSTAKSPEDSAGLQFVLRDAYLLVDRVLGAGIVS